MAVKAESVARGPLPLWGAVVAFFAIAVLCCFNFLYVGLACQPIEGPSQVDPHSGAASICRWIDPTWERPVLNGPRDAIEKFFNGHIPPNDVFPPSTFEKIVRPALFFFTPIVLVVVAIALTWWRRDIRFFKGGLLAAAVLAIGLPVVFAVSSS